MPPLQLYNTLTKKKETFIPMSFGRVLMYTCGVTVYDECHIGHCRSLYLFDCFRRYLERLGYHVTFIRNITDIDDKIINRARELNKPFAELTDEYIKKYYADMKLFDIAPATSEPRATEHIGDMTQMISGLLEKGFAYVVNGDVYFRVRAFDDYGKLSGQGIDAMKEAVRIDPDEKKEDPLDFVLWKKAKPGEPEFWSPWSKGRPGWHIECSVMSSIYLGQTFDIHGGGMDLVFPHHENEIAQSQAFSGKPFARYWMHAGLLTIRGQKMSKSLGNFISMSDFAKEYHPDLLKLFFLSGHYASSLDYTPEKMVEMQKARERFMAVRRRMSLVHHEKSATVSKHLGSTKDFQQFAREYEESLADDFNTAKAQGVVFEVINYANRVIDDDEISSKDKAAIIVCIEHFLQRHQKLFALNFDEHAHAGQVSEHDILRLIEERTEAKKQKDYKRADRVRQELREQGVVLEDTKDGVQWHRV